MPLATHMTRYPRVFNNSILRTWVIAMVCCTLVATVVYGMMTPERGNGFEQGVAYFLFPGVALYSLLNGSLLFGGGFGNTGDFLIIGLSSALVWSFVVVLVVQGFSWLRHRHGR
jgi:hypothetical protein